MGIWKAQVSSRINIELRQQLEVLAAKELRTLGNLTSLLLEWASAQLQKAGSTEKLMKRRMAIPRNPDGNYKRGPRT